MAAPGTVKWLAGYPTYTKNKVAKVGTLTGPKSYVNGTGVAVYSGDMRSIDWADGAITLSGTYNVAAQPSATIAGTAAHWNFRFFVISTGLEVANATDLSGETVQIMVLGG